MLFEYILFAFIIGVALWTLFQLWKILRVRLFGKKYIGTVVGYKNKGYYRTWSYYTFEVKIRINGKEVVVDSVNSFKIEGAMKPKKHLNCEMDVYYYEKNNKCFVCRG